MIRMFLRFMALSALFYGIMSVNQPTCSRLAVTRPQSMKNCKLYINEFNIDTMSGARQFIELGRYCDVTPTITSKLDMSKYRLLVISADGYLVNMCVSKKEKKASTKDEFYFVYGGQAVFPEGKAVDALLEECQYEKIVFANTGLYIPAGIDTPFALALVHNKEINPLKSLELNFDGVNFQKKFLLPKDYEVIRTNLANLYVFGSKTPFVSCDVFTTIVSRYSEGADKIIRDWHTTNMRDMSVSRCSNTNFPFVINDMVYSLPTPNTKNNCQAGFKSQIEKDLPTLAMPRSIQVGLSADKNCYIVNDNDAISHLNQIAAEGDFNDFMETAAFEEVINFETHDTINYENIDTEFVIDLESIPNGLNTKFIWDDCSKFDSHWESQIKSNIDLPLDINKILDKNVCFWIDFFQLNPKAPTLMRCKLCHALVTSNIVTINKNLPKMVSQGYMKLAGKDRKFRNHKKIAEHKDSKLHQIAMQYFSNVDQNLQGKDLKIAMMKRHKPFYQFYQPTENLVILVYQSVRASLSFNSFKLYTDLLTELGVNIGSRFQNPEGMRKILIHTSDMMHKKLISYFLTKKPPVCVVLDSSTDIEGKQSLAVLFNTIDLNNRPKTYFYKLIELPKGETGAQMFSAFKQSLVDDGLDQYFKRHLTGCTTDGCSSMNSTFREAFGQFTQYEYVHTHCQSHRYELVVSNGIRTLDVIRRTESLVNNLHAYMGPHSPKKKRILEETIAEQKDSSFTLKRIQPIRWAASKHRALLVIANHWKTIIIALDKIQSLKGFTSRQQQIGKEIIKEMKSAYIIATLGFVTDVIGLFKEVSEHLQIRGSTLIDKTMLRIKLAANIDTMRDFDGTSLSNFLSNSQSVSNPTPQSLSVDNFESNAVLLFGIPLNMPNSSESSLYLSNNRNLYLDRLLFQLEKYFPDSDATDKFSIFDCQTWPKNLADIQNLNFGSSELKLMNTELKWDFVERDLLADWTKLIVGLKQDDNFDTMCDKSPEEFYAFYLNTEKCMDVWTANTKQLVQIVLTIQATSAEAERVFGIYTGQKSSRRYKLKVSTVDAITRIRFNGEKSISKVDSFSYAKSFAKEHLLADEKAWNKDRKTSDELEPHFLSIFERDNPDDDCDLDCMFD